MRGLYLLALLLLAVCLFIFPGNALAHLAGQPPFFKINDRYSNLYPVPTTSLPDFVLPQDLASDNYVVNQAISFEIVTEMLPVPKEIVSQSKFFWDFGDGTDGSGTKNTHSYRKMGSYLLSIDAQAPSDPKATLIQTVLFHILPDKDYKLPKAIIKVNGKKSKDPLTDILSAKFDQEIQFDASESVAGKSKIVSYLWDFGDGQHASGVSTSHKYQNDIIQTFVVLRVTTQDGFQADSYLELDNENAITSNPAGVVQSEANGASNILGDNLITKVVIGAIILAGIGGGTIIGRKLREHKK